MVCVCLRMQCYFITQAVGILYDTLCARGLADYGTEGKSTVISIIAEAYWSQEEYFSGMRTNDKYEVAIENGRVTKILLYKDKDTKTKAVEYASAEMCLELPNFLKTLFAGVVDVD